MTLDEFCAWTKNQRKQRGLTLKGAAEITGLTPQTVLAVEQGHRPYLDTIERIAKGYGHRVDVTIVLAEEE